ncbi:MAG: hypothetical protein ACI9MR_004280 [Myxococcota bacterium]|jgi:hypothetical protein
MGQLLVGGMLDSWVYEDVSNIVNCAAALMAAVGLFFWRRTPKVISVWLLASWALLFAVVSFGLFVAWLVDSFDLYTWYDFRLSEMLEDLGHGTFFAMLGTGVMSIVSVAWSLRSTWANRLIVWALIAFVAAGVLQLISNGVGVPGPWVMLSKVALAGGFVLVAVATTRVVQENVTQHSIADAF